MELRFLEIFSVFLILFSVIDILGDIPIIIDLRQKAGKIESEKATLAAGGIMILFLFVGEPILKLFGVDIGSFAIAGGIILFLLGLEMVLGRSIFKPDQGATASTSMVPLAFPLLAGAGTMTTIIALKAEFETINILIGIILNLALIYLVLKTSGWLQRRIGPAGFSILRKVFGIILLAIAIKLIKSNLHILRG